jgi:Domain of unknown function (DUF4157)
MESAFSFDFAAVRVHTGAAAQDAASALGARALTAGTDILFRTGEYLPGTPGGDLLLAHELAHVVQQAGGLTRVAIDGGASDPLEKAAETAADRIVASGQATDLVPAPSAQGRHLSPASTDDASHRAADSLYALAFTAHSHAGFRAGRFSPGPVEGQQLLPHEQTHVLQQRPGAEEKGVQSRLRVGQTADNYGQEADRVANHVMSRDIIANACAAGHNIMSGAGRFVLGTNEGRRLLAYEPTHVVQPSGSVESPLYQTDQKRNLSFTHSFQTVQRQRVNYHAGGCATCRTASVAGTLAHPFAQQLFVDKYGRRILPEIPIYNPADEENGRLDLLRLDTSGHPKIAEIGEIKPDNDRGVSQGSKDLDWYEEKLIERLGGTGWRVSRLDAAAPSATIGFKDNAQPNCPSQTLSVRSVNIGGPPGLYLYKCDPPGRPPKTARASCCQKDDEEQEESPVTDLALHVAKAAAQSYFEKKGAQGVIEEAAAEEGTEEAAAWGGEALAGGGGAIAAAVAVPVIAVVAEFVALGAGYAEAREAVSEENTISGFSQGFVMGLLGWEWSQVVDRFGRSFVLRTNTFYEELDVVRDGAYNSGLKAGYAVGHRLPYNERKAYLKAIRVFAGPRGSKTWTRRDQISYVIDLSAIARLHLLKPE